MANKKMAVLVEIPDSYLDVFDVFYSAFLKNWADCPFDIFLCTQTIPQYKDIKCFSAGVRANWIERTVYALKKINAKYVLILDADNIIGCPVHNSDFYRYISFMELNRINYCKVWPSPRPRKKYKIKSTNDLFFVDKRQRYGRNLAASIWNKAHYIDLLNSFSKMSGWEVENMWLNECLYSEKGHFDDYIVSNSNPLNIVHGVYKGKWIPKSVKEIKKIGINGDFYKRGLLPKKVVWTIKIKRIFRSLIPNCMVKISKSFLKKVGFNFDTDC